MDRRVSAANANRKFSQLLRSVRQGRSFVVTAHGEPVARIVPAAARDSARDHARKTLLQRLQAEPVRKIGRWKRDELYE